MKPILKICDLSKAYQIGKKKERYLSLRDNFLESVKSNFQKKSTFWALKDINYDIYPGDMIGIIGKNGAGKSTLLKIISKITPPTKGHIKARGRIASLLEVGTGFHPELTGRENIYFNGSILGMNRSEIKSSFDEIVDFSGVENFIDTPLKHFSSGMQLRLAFAVAAFLQPEILVIDEVLAVGDAEFQKKCLGKMEDVSKNEGRTILFVSHNLGAVERLCKKGICLEAGRLIHQGPIKEVIERYTNIKEQIKKEYPPGNILKEISISLQPKLQIQAVYGFKEAPKIPHLGFVITNSKNEELFGSNPTLEGIPINKTYNKEGLIIIDIEAPIFASGTYNLSIWFGDGLNDQFFDQDCLTFTIPTISRKRNLGFIIPNCSYTYR